MSIKITDKYEIRADEYQFIVVEKKVAKSGKNAGKEYESIVGYSPTVEYCLEIIYQRETRKWVTEHDATLSMAAKEFGKIAKEIKDYGKKFNLE